jgi:hypothetical protein
VLIDAPRQSNFRLRASFFAAIITTAATPDSHPDCRALLIKILALHRGKVEFDGQERVSSQTILDMLEIPQRSRTAGMYRRLAKLMAELGWTAVRVRDLTRGGYKEQVRGYVRDRAVALTQPLHVCTATEGNPT